MNKPYSVHASRAIFYTKQIPGSSSCLRALGHLGLYALEGSSSANCITSFRAISYPLTLTPVPILYNNQSLQKNAIMRLHNSTHNQPNSAYSCRGRIFSNMPHFHRINCQFPRTKQPFPPVAMGTLWSDVITRRKRFTSRNVYVYSFVKLPL